jgi:hypothetical protein
MASKRCPGVIHPTPRRGRAHPSQGQGRAQIVVEFEPELPFEIVRGSQRGAEPLGAEGAGAETGEVAWEFNFAETPAYSSRMPITVVGALFKAPALFIIRDDHWSGHIIVAHLP